MPQPSLRTFAIAALLASFAGGTSACTVTTDDGTDAGTVTGSGRLEVYWTVAGLKDSTSCSLAGASYARVVVLNSSGVQVNVGTDTQTCTTYATSFSAAFPSGAYTVQSTLLGADNTTAVTTTISSTVVVPSDGSTAVLNLDFPTTSFVHPTTGTGKLEVYWTLEGSADPNECTTRSVANAQIDVFDASGTKVETGGDLQACTALGTSFTTLFNAGTYTVRATLLGTDSTARTSTATATTTIASDGSTATVRIDFPSTSFY